jgi:hypothetical protein
MRFLMFLGIIFVVGMLVFGGNPLREFQARQKEMLKKYGSDELTIRTNLYLEQQQNSGSGMLGGGAPSEPTNETSMINSIKSSGTADYVAKDIPSDAIVKVAKPDDEEEDYVGIEVNKSTEAEAAKQIAKTSNYYPPIVGQIDPQQAQQKPIVLTGKEPKLRSGQVIAFEGTFVYLVDQYGNRKTMPDGTYNLQDGSTIVVTNGRSMLR